MRTSILILALAAAFSNAPPGARAADTVPKFDIVKNCKAEMAATSAVGGTQASCEKDEEQARQQLIQKWAQFAKDDKLACIRETRSDGSPSYVELETCLEIATDNKARLTDSK
jgi:hypothetical protein